MLKNDCFHISYNPNRRNEHGCLSQIHSDETIEMGFWAISSNDLYFCY